MLLPGRVKAQSRHWSFQGGKHSPGGKGTLLRLRPADHCLERQLDQPRWTPGDPSPAYQVHWQNNLFLSLPFFFRPSREIPPRSARKPARAGLLFVLFRAYLHFQTTIIADILLPESDGVMPGLGCLQRLTTHPGNAFCSQCLILPVHPSLCTLNLRYSSMELSMKINQMQQRWTRNKWDIVV